MSTTGGVDRPLGVAILAVIDIIGGILAVIVGLFYIVASAYLAAFLEPFFGPAGIVAGFLGAIGTAIGVVFLVIGAIIVVVAWGLWSGREWGRIGAIVLSIIGSLFGVLVLLVAIGAAGLVGLVIIAINAIVVYYLIRPHVKAFFAQQVVRVPPAAAPI